MIRVLINGARGRMGCKAVERIASTKTLCVVAQTGRSDDLVSAIKDSEAQVVLDLTSAASVYANTLAIIETGVHPVIGTSGLLEAQIYELTQLCDQKKLGGLIVPNFSIGAVLAMQYAQNCARYFSDMEIIEAHHPHKKDAPSSTALRTAEMMAAARKNTASKTSHLSVETLTGARGAQYLDIPIHAIRLPGVLAQQTVWLGAEGETVSIQHQVSDREAYMPGLVLACEKVVHLKTLKCGLEWVLE